MNGRVHQWLSDDHARLDALLTRATADPATIEQHAFAEFRVGLLRHIAMEEKILLPAARRLRGGEPLESAARLRADHGRIAALLVRSPTHETASRLREILEAHNQFEEGSGGVYAVCEQLAHAELDALFEQLMNAPTVPAAPYYDGPIKSRSHS